MRFQAPTILSLILLGFLVVLLPILLGLTRSFETLESMSRNHERAMVGVVTFTEAAEAATGSLADVERSARQYALLQEASFLDVFNDRYISLRESLLKLANSEDAAIKPIADLMIEEIDAVHPIINNKQTEAESEAVTAALARFEKLFLLSGRLREEVSRFAQNKVERARERVGEVSAELVVYVVTLIPLTAVLILIFTVLILKPLRQIDRVIRRLGEGDYTSDVIIQGPQDLKRVGRRLGWLGKQLVVAEEEKMKFLRHISHELKTPLSTIKESTELLIDEVPGPLTESQKEVLAISQRAVDSFQALINNLLDFNLMTREATLHKAMHSIEDLVRDTLGAHTLTASRKNLTVDVQGEDHKIRIDRSVMKAALDNLISNAVTYTDEGGKVEISWYETDKGDLILDVKDDGPGISVSEQEQVFLPFYQGKSRKKGPLKGTGLGLSVARECVQSHGGELSITNSSKGAHFRMRLPGQLEGENPG